MLVYASPCTGAAPQPSPITGERRPPRDPSVVKIDQFIEQPRRFRTNGCFRLAEYRPEAPPQTLIFIRPKSLYVVLQAKLWMSRVIPTTPFIRAVVGYWGIHRPADSEVTRIGRKGRCIAIRVEAHSSSLGTGDRPLLARRSLSDKNNHAHNRAGLFTKLTTGSK